MTPFAPWLARWDLTPDGEPFQTRYARNWLLPVFWRDAPAMLKIATSQAEIDGAATMAWWAGGGAARVLAFERDALLLERLPARRSLVAMAQDGLDEDALRILCTVADDLHAPRDAPPPRSLHPLDGWLRALAPAAAAHGGVLNASLHATNLLLAQPREVAVLHGDLHHENVLDGDDRGWLAIDPKGVLGERAYDYAAMLCNPHEAGGPKPGRIPRQVAVVAEAARLEPRRLLHWLLAHAGASAAWCMSDGFDPGPALATAEAARQALGA
ncbi:aminoglycoside phosphotransferase family protein [Phenylobacterium sp.]|uniref:aminoglycoside phosphotransferase family protein n=1 Tax=Phenylobacterium sp. TaxID=1871053 RepID=UPI002E36111C|nr:aminoglycoside phosphotransferase family protein [Phenylobacterium sp.]